MLVILAGVAGAGKDTVKQELIKKMKNIDTLPSFTTRPMREGDVEGGTYYFVSKEDFENRIKNNEFYEYDIHHNNYYGTSRVLLNQKIDSGKIIVKDIDVNGTENLVKLLSGDTKIITIFLKISKEEMKNRLKQRIDHPDEKEIELRLSRYDYETTKSIEYDYVINNNDLEKTVNVIMSIIENENKENS